MGETKKHVPCKKKERSIKERSSYLLSPHVPVLPMLTLRHHECSQICSPKQLCLCVRVCRVPSSDLKTPGDSLLLCPHIALPCFCPARRPTHPFRRRGLVFSIVETARIVRRALLFWLLAFVNRNATVLSVAHPMRKSTDLVAESDASHDSSPGIGATMARGWTIQAPCTNPPGPAMNQATTTGPWSTDVNT
jgi:hypothetical protein